jgi:hypothetical protein
MPFQLKFDKNLPAGFCVQSVKGPGPVLVSEFVSSDDGEILINRLQGLSDMLFGAIRPHTIFNPAYVNHFLAVVRPDGTGTLFVNDVSSLSLMQPKREFKKGEPVSFDDIADVQRMRLLHAGAVIDVPKDAGVVLFFPVGWRRGLYYDFSPLPQGSGLPRDRDLEVILGQYYAYLAFQERLRFTGEEMDRLIEEKWFLFISLSTRTIQNMLNHLRSGRQVDELLDAIHDEVAKALPAELQKWERNPVFAEHMAVLRTGAERYLAGDYISSVSVLFPRIEGLLRSYHVIERLGGPLTQNALMDAAVMTNPNVRHENCLLLPGKFQAYLAKVFFARFDPKDPQELTRHTMAHGVTPVANFNKKGATLGLLILSQLAYYLIPRGSAANVALPTTPDSKSAG